MQATLKKPQGFLRQQKALEYRETVAGFQIAKKRILHDEPKRELFPGRRGDQTRGLCPVCAALFWRTTAADYVNFFITSFFSKKAVISLAARALCLIGGFSADMIPLKHSRPRLRIP